VRRAKSWKWTTSRAIINSLFVGLQVLDSSCEAALPRPQRRSPPSAGARFECRQGRGWRWCIARREVEEIGAGRHRHCIEICGGSGRGSRWGKKAVSNDFCSEGGGVGTSVAFFAKFLPKTRKNIAN
jgi:hypothetical protein